MIEGYRLSPHQQHLWQLQADQVFRSQLVLEIKGNPNVKGLRDALQILVDHHEILRTTFHRQPGMKTPIQRVNQQGTLDWQIWDWSDLDPNLLEDKLWDFLEAEKQIPIALDQDPVLRARLLECSQGQMMLALTLPALCADGWTLQLISQNLTEAYLKGVSAFPLEEQGQYVQFAEWQNQLLEDQEESQQGIQFWQDQNLGSLPDPVLPLEKRSDRGSDHGFQSHSYSVLLSTTQLQQIKALAKLHNSSIEQILFTLWVILIWKLTQQRDLKVHGVCQGRPFDELKEIMGIMAKTLPIRCNLHPHYSFREALDRIVKDQKEAKDWQDFYLWDDTHDPISFEMMRSLDLSDANGIKITPLQTSSDWDRYKLKLICRSSQAKLDFEFRYNDQYFLRNDIQRLSSQYQLLIDQILDSPQISLQDLSLLSSTDRDQVLVDFNPTEIAKPLFPCLHHWFEAQVKQTPDRIALIYEDQQLTYRTLNAQANRLAYHLNSLGVTLETPVALYLGRSPWIVIALLAVLKAGGAYLPLDQDLPADAIALRLQDSGCPILLSQQSFLERIPDTTALVIWLDTEWDQLSNDPTQDPVQDPSNPSLPHSLAYILFTSGSTGRPKGVAVEHRQIVNYLQGILTRLDLPVGTQFATVSSFAADLGNTMIFPALCSGGTLHILAQERVANPNALADYTQSHAIDCLKIVPSHLAVLLASPQAASLLPRRYLILGGETTRWDLLERLQSLSPSCQILNHYGPTETTVGVVMEKIPPPQDSPAHTAPLGRPLPHSRIYILDGDLNPLPVGLPGELYIAGAGLSRGYLHLPDRTAERFIPDPYSPTPGGRLYRTGDRARHLPDGSIEFLGRVDHQVKLRGFRVELGEIEAMLSTHPGIRQAVVTLWQDQDRDPRLVAYVVVDPAQPPNTSDLRGFLKQKLPAPLCPSLYIPLRILPLTSNGKVDRQALPSPDLERPDLEARYEPPRTDLERTLARIWQEVLQVKQVGIQDTFFDLGGHSLLLIQLHSQLQTELERQIPITDLFRYPTISALAGFLSQSAEKEGSGLEHSQQRANTRLTSRGQRGQLRQRARTSQS